MINLFYLGNPVLMGILTLLLLIVFSITVVLGTKIFTHKVSDSLAMRHLLTYIKSVGLFALVFGIFGQLIGLYGAFSAIEAAGYITPSLLYEGLRMASLPTIYGIIIFLLSYLLWLGLDVRLNRISSAG